MKTKAPSLEFCGKLLNPQSTFIGTLDRGSNRLMLSSPTVPGARHNGDDAEHLPPPLPMSETSTIALVLLVQGDHYFGVIVVLCC